MNSRPSLLFAVAIATLPGATARLRHARSALHAAAATRDPRDEEPFCVFWGRDDDIHGPTSSPVQVFVGSDNSRSLFFGTDDMGTQTSVKCAGDAPPNCAGTDRSSSFNGTQSCEYLRCDCKRDTSELEFSYMNKMMSEVLPVCEKPRGVGDTAGGFKMLLIGLGGGALPSYTLAHCPEGSKVESVEYDARVVSAATNFFGFDVRPGVNEVETSDGGRAVQERVDQGASYDVVLVDCFQTGGVVPESCRSPAFVDGLKKILRPGGKAIQQVWNGQFQEMKKSYGSVFGQDHVRDVGLALGLNYLVVAEQPSE